ncbi:MAG TPA: TauD/TfdA family dioxygenase [Candidatus Saccharimonadales bacterium]|nr:TauD/TfdA family dioxygenase [Candidatus Saccharimonadales bacterium]
MQLHPERVLEIAQSLGTVMLEPRQSVRESAYKGCITSIRANKSPDEDDTQQVHSTGDMPLHIDQALTAPSQQPTYYLLGCVRPPVLGNGGDTVISFNQPVLDKLSPEQTELLRQSRQRILRDRDGMQVSGSTFISTLDGQDYLSFWNKGTYGEDWVLDTPPGYTQAEVKQAVSTVLSAAHDPENARFVPWQAGRIMIADNHQSLHGRTAQLQPSSRELLHAKVLPEGEMPEIYFAKQTSAVDLQA